MVGMYRPLLDLLPAARRLSWTPGQLRNSDRHEQSLTDGDTAVVGILVFGVMRLGFTVCMFRPMELLGCSLVSVSDSV